ncbi:uncharacterized protein PAC_09289 [Phialocephala subalpina]|uniref:Lysophospholipase n=1 Tax=Phialocephala subalpina TaxID=576137 RepID=A0A1L7X324_9HELO|nr:uncharacterized protein PAC_09289 [Phialocephala subalpina]
MSTYDKYNPKRSSEAAEQQHQSLKSKSFWNNAIKPALPEAITDISILKSVMSIQSNTKSDMHDTSRYPEVAHVASVRRGLDLCSSEQRFLSDRKLKAHSAFAKYLGLELEDVHPDDVPTALAAYYTFGEASMARTIEIYKHRLSPHHPLSGDAIQKPLTTHDDPYATLAPVAIKQHGCLHAVPNGLLLRLPHRLRIHPHETGQDVAEKNQEKDARFQWFESTPFEIGCDELSALVPTWGFGCSFSEGKSTMQPPEQSLSLLLGLCTGTSAGPLESYLATIKRALPRNFIQEFVKGVTSKVSKLWGKNSMEEFTNHHPLHASNEHNFLFHYSKLEPGQIRPPGLENSPRIHLVDAGMDNNCSTYVLLRPERVVDVILNMDASSDVSKDIFQEQVDQIGGRRGVKFSKRYPDLKSKPNEKDPGRFEGMYAQVYDGTLCDCPATVKDSYGHTVTNPPAPVCHQECIMVYLPLLPNERAVPDFDLSIAQFSGS